LDFDHQMRQVIADPAHRRRPSEFALAANPMKPQAPNGFTHALLRAERTANQLRGYRIGQLEFSRIADAPAVEPQLHVGRQHARQAFLGAIDALADRFRHFVGLAESEADQSVMIACDYQRAEAEAASALHDFRDAIDMDDLFLDLEALRIDPLRHAAFAKCP